MLPLASINNLTCILRECTRKDSPALQIYMCRHGLHAHNPLGNHVVLMFVESGNKKNAFDGLQFREACSWNMLITGCVNSGEWRHALILYDRMREEFLQPDGSTYVALLKACVEVKDVRRGCQLHAEIDKDILLQGDPFIGNKLIDLYAKCGSLVEAQNVFDKLVCQDVVSWNSLISGYLKHERWDDAIKCLDEMLLKNVSPNAITLVHGLKACVLSPDLERGRGMHINTVRKGYDKTDKFVGNALVDMYAKLGSLEDARQVVDRLSDRDVVSWTALIAGYVKQEHYKEALSCLEQMELEGVPPSAVTFVCVLKACGNTGYIEKGIEMHIRAAEEGLMERNLVVGNAMVDMYAKCGFLAQAHDVFDKLPVQDVISWNALIAGYVENEYNEEAVACSKEMQTKGVSPDNITFVSALKASGNARAIELGIEIHAEVARRGLVGRDDVIGNAVVDMYAKCGFFARAQELLDILPSHTVVSWTCLMAEYVRHGLAEEALTCLERMQQEGLCPSAVTFSCCVKACGMIVAIEKGKALHAEVQKKGMLEVDADIGSILTDMYAKCGLLAEAHEMFDKLPFRSVVSWNALVAGHVVQERGIDALNCFVEMECDNVIPNEVTFAYTLKACGSIEDISKGREMHVLIVRRGLLEIDLTLGIALVDMYARCGILDEAQKVFVMLPSQEIAMWTSLIMGFVKHELFDRAITCFEKMQEEDLSPNAVILVCILKACGSIKNMDIGRNIHAEISRSEFIQSDLALGNAVIDLYAKCGSLNKAQEVFDKVLVRDVISWNTLIGGYSQYDHPDEALNLFEQMKEAGIYPDDVTFDCILKACSALGATENGMGIHAEISRRGLLERENAFGGALVNLYIDCGRVDRACEVLDTLHLPDVTAWTALISGYTKYECLEELLRLYNQMQLEGVHLTTVTCVCILKACGSIGAFVKGREIHAIVGIKGPLSKDLAIGNATVDMYAKCGSMLSAEEAFDKLPVRDTSSWSALIAGYSNVEFYEEVLDSYERMQLEGVSPNAVSLACVFRACGCLGVGDKGIAIHAKVSENLLLEADLVVSNALVHMYASCGLLTKAQEMFDKLPVRDIATWTALIVMYAEHESSEKALSYLEWMLSCYKDATLCCGGMGDNADDAEIHDVMVKRKLWVRNLLVGSALVHAYTRHGALTEARKVFHMLPARDVVLWTSLMAGYVKHQRMEETLNCYKWMQREGVPPDSVTYIFVLRACGTMGATQMGQDLHSEIARKGLLEREIVVGNALVNMYAKCGLLAKAQEVFGSLQLVDMVAWTALIAGYAETGDSERVFVAFEMMRSEGRRPDLATFLGVLDACSHAELWDRGQAYFETMQEEYGISPTLKHYNCMVDLLGRSGALDSSIDLMKGMPLQPDHVIKRTIMGACQTLGNVDLGGTIFDQRLATG